MLSHRRKCRRRALFSSVYAWEHQYSCISSRTRLLQYDWLWFLRECDGTRGVKRPITTAPGFQVSTVSWWSIHSCPAFILHSLHSRQPRKVSLRGASLSNQKVLPPYIWTCRIVFMSYAFVQTFLFTKEHLPFSRLTRDSPSIVNLTGPDTSHSCQPRNGSFVPWFGERNMYQ